LQEKFYNLKSGTKRQKKRIAARSSLPKPIQVVPVVPAETSNSNLFLNRIKGQFLETLYNQMISHNLLPHINTKNLVYITADQIKPLKSYNEKNGTYYHWSENYIKLFFIIGDFIVNWLSCRVEPRYITNPPERHPQLTLHNRDATRTIKCEKFNAEKQKIMNELDIKHVGLFKHHVVLLRKKLSVPVLMVTEATTSGMFSQLLVTESKVIFLFS
jgi:hypothetical protein